MQENTQLDQYLETDCADRPALAATLSGLARAGALVAEMIRNPAGPPAALRGAPRSAHGDEQHVLDLACNEVFARALADSPVAWMISEEDAQPRALDPAQALVVAVDPLDGSSNIETNLSIGSIFSVLEHPDPGSAGDLPLALLRGSRQQAAGFLLYGPRTSLVLSVGHGTHMFTRDDARDAFVLTRAHVSIPEQCTEYAINASNYRHWDPPVKAFIDDLMAGTDGPRGENSNMRWTASLVADVYRILVRGGVYLYPGDAREGYRDGRLRLLYEANPVAMLVEQAGGRASDGVTALGEIEPRDIHQRVPVIFGSAEMVRRFERYNDDRFSIGERSPLFGNRNLHRH